MQQLSGSDTGFLYAEKGNNYNHVGSLAIYDPATTEGGEVRFKDILPHFEDKMYSNPVFSRRLVDVPWSMDRPYWADVPNKDVEFHVRHIALPAPGDWRQLMIQVARLHSRPLDRAHPLWEVYVIGGLNNIPGLPKGCFGMFYNMHHAAVDGMASMHVIRQLHSDFAQAEDRSGKARVMMADRYPNLLELTTRAAINSSRRALQMSKLVASISRKILTSLSTQSVKTVVVK